MGSVEDYYKLMEDERRDTSAQFSMIPPELQPSGDDPRRGAGFGEPTPEQAEREAAVQEYADEMKDRRSLQRYQDQGELMGYSPEPITQTLGDILYTGAATARHLKGEEGAGTDAAMGVGMMALPFSGLMVRSMGKSLQKAAKSMKGMSAETLRKNLGTIDEKATKRLESIDFDLRAGKITSAEADIYRGQVEGRVKEAVGKAETIYNQGRRGVKSSATRRADHDAMNKARAAEGKAPIPYSPAPAYGTGGMMEDTMSQPFKGGETIITGRKGARSASVEDTMRESRQILDPSNTRLPTASERKQLDELGEIVTRDPSAPPTAIVDDSGSVLMGKPGTKAAKGAPDPYPEGTGDVISRMPLEREYTKGLGKGSVGMSDSLVHNLSEIAKKEFPTHFDERRLVVDASRYFDALTPAQQKQVLAKAKIQPGLSRDIARHETSIKEAAQRASAPTTPASRTKSERVRRNLSEQRQAALDKQQKSRAEQSTREAAKKQGSQSFNDDEIAFLSSIDDDVKRDEARKMLTAARAQGTTVTRNAKGEFIFTSEASAVPKKAPEAPKPKSNVQGYEDWKAQKKSKPAEKPKDLPRLKKK